MITGKPIYPKLMQLGTYGVPVNCVLYWDWDMIEQAISQEPHHSELNPEDAAKVKEDIEYQLKAGFSQIFL